MDFYNPTYFRRQSELNLLSCVLRHVADHNLLLTNATTVAEKEIM